MTLLLRQTEAYRLECHQIALEYLRDGFETEIRQLEDLMPHEAGEELAESEAMLVRLYRERRDVMVTLAEIRHELRGLGMSGPDLWPP